MRFTEFLIRDEAARKGAADPWLSESAATDIRKGVAFKQRSLDDLEHAVFAQRLADKLRDQGGGSYGDFLHRSVLKQGEVLADMAWEGWAVTKRALELGGVNPDQLTTPAARVAAVKRIDWSRVTLPRLKAKLGSSFHVPDGWKRQFGIAKLKKIKAADEQGNPLDARERKLLGIWRRLEVQLAGNILPAGPDNDAGRTRMPMSLADRVRLYKTLTGTANEAVVTPLQLSPQSAYDYLTRYGVEVISDDEVTNLYLSRILQDLRTGNAFIPSSARGSEADRKRWRDSAARSWGGFLAPARSYDPGNTPGFAQWLTGMTTRGFKIRTNPSGRRVPSGYPEPEESGRVGDIPPIRYSIDVPSQEVADERINAFYRSGTAEANAAVQLELVKPARDTLRWLRHTGWEVDPSKLDDYVQQVVMGMMARTGAVRSWRTNPAFRRSTALMLARRYISQGWGSETREKTGRGDILDRATDRKGLDSFATIQGSVARAREAVQRAIALLRDVDTAAMDGDDEEAFVAALRGLRSPNRAVDALDILDRLATRYERKLPQVKRAVERIRRHLEPLLRKVA